MKLMKLGTYEYAAISRKHFIINRVYTFVTDVLWVGVLIALSIIIPAIMY